MYSLLNIDGCIWLGEGGCGGRGGEGDERFRQEKGVEGGWARRQTQFGVVVESIDHLIIVVSEWMSRDWCAHMCVCVCVCVCVVYCVSI